MFLIFLVVMRLGILILSLSSLFFVFLTLFLHNWGSVKSRLAGSRKYGEGYGGGSRISPFHQTLVGFCLREQENVISHGVYMGFLYL